MVIITKKAIIDFIEQEPDSKTALLNWYQQTKDANWPNFNQMKKSFNSVDAVGNDLYIFNIKANNYRLIARILFKVRTVFIKFIGTHSQYDEVDLDDL